MNYCRMHNNNNNFIQRLDNVGSKRVWEQARPAGLAGRRACSREWVNDAEKCAYGNLQALGSA